MVRGYAANTHQGLIRNYNEDRVSIILNISEPESRKNMVRTIESISVVIIKDFAYAFGVNMYRICPKARTLLGQSAHSLVSMMGTEVASVLTFCETIYTR